MSDKTGAAVVRLDVENRIWDRVFQVAPLVLIGTRDPDGGHNLAPKHMVTALSWDNYFGFVCTPAHQTYHNAVREGGFTVTFPRPDQLVLASLAAAPRCDDSSKPALAALPIRPARILDAVFLEGGYLFLECEVVRVIDDLGPNSLFVSRVIAAEAREDALRGHDRDDGDLLSGAPLLAYLHPGRFAEIKESFAFPYSRELAP